MTEKKIEKEKEAGLDQQNLTAEVSEDFRFGELKDATDSLVNSAAALQRNAQATSFDEAVGSIRELAKSISSLAQQYYSKPQVGSRTTWYTDLPEGLYGNSKPGSGYYTTPMTNYYAKPQDGCGCANCLSTDCCEFEIRMTEVRVLEMQSIISDPADAGILPSTDLEIRMFASMDGIGTVIPSMFTTLNITKPIDRVGLWTQINTPIGTVVGKKDQTTTKVIRVDALEVDAGLEQAQILSPAGDEGGTGSGSINLDCCANSSSECTFEVPFAAGGGRIEVRFNARRR